MPDLPVDQYIDDLMQKTSAAQTRAHLELGTAATSSTTDFATGAEGDLAATALQESSIDTLAKLNAIVTETLIDDTDARLTDQRTPLTHDHPLTDLQQSGATDEQIVQWNDTAQEWQATTLTTGGDMLASTYDDTNKQLNVYSMDNADETATKKVLTDLERTAIADNSNKVSADGSVTTHSDVTNAGSGAIITAVERTAIGDNTAARHTHANKATLDGITASYTTEEETKLGTFWEGNNLSATADPVVTDDANSGYEVGSVWVNTTLDTAFRCVDNTVGAAVWTSGGISDAQEIRDLGFFDITNDGDSSGLDADLLDGKHAIELAASSSDSTGVLTGGVLSLGATSTRYTVSDGTGIIVDELGNKTEVTWSSLFNIEPTNINLQQITFVSIDSNGAIIEQADPWTPQERRQQICIGVAVHVDFTNVVNVNNEQIVSFNPHSTAYDIGEALGFLNLSGNEFMPNGLATMAIEKDEGEIFKMGSNYDVSPLSPHNKILPQLAPVIFGYRYSAGNTDFNQTVIDPNNLDDGANGLTLISGNPTANRWSIQRVYSFISNNVFIQRGREEFGSLADAIAGIGTEAYETESSIAANGLFRGYIIVKKGETDLNSANTTFISASKFGAAGAGSGASPHTPEGTAVLSTGETEGIKYLQEQGNNTSEWEYVYETLGFACSDETTFPIEAGDKIKFDCPFDFRVTRVYATVNDFPTVSSLFLNIRAEGVEILGTDLAIPAGTHNGETSVFAGAAANYLINKNDEIICSVELQDSGLAASGLKVFMEGIKV